MSVYAKLVAAGLVVLMLAAFGWRMHHAGYVRGAADVQDRWDRQTAQASQQTQAAIAQAASDALANSHAAGVVSAAAEQHQANVAEVHDQLTKRVQDYAKSQPVSSATHGQANADQSGRADGPVLDAVGLRIWNDANAGTGGGNGSASAGAGVAAGEVSGRIAGGR
ncbi:hypothetical protein WJ98_29540 [Burkholderia ubonensis]|nr:hypothetical protein WJ98_28945 [Burkholderia ubonensis]KVQ12578.1 hypothetical protein WJ98_29540 [Burkholderia ubonensis]